MAKRAKKGMDPSADGCRPAEDDPQGVRKELSKLQVELTRLQAWAVAEGARVIVVFEGGIPPARAASSVASCSAAVRACSSTSRCPRPPIGKSQLYIQRYLAHFPAAGEIVLFDRSWYNRAGVERVMGFCTDDEYEHFLRLAPAVEREVIHDGIILLKYFLDVSQAEQRRRFESRITDPVKHWKLSPMDVEAVRRWWDYTKAYQAMIEATDTPVAPWYVVPADDQRRARLNLISHVAQHSLPAGSRRSAENAQSCAAPQGVAEGLRAGQVVANLY